MNWNKLNRFRMHEGDLFCLTATQPIKFPKLDGASVSHLLPLDLETKSQPLLQCEHEWATEQRTVRAGDEMVTIIRFCVKCNHSIRHG